MQAKNSKRIVDNAAPDGGQDLWVWDTELRGFGLRVRPSGHKAYVVEYRPGSGGRSVQKRRFTIGAHGSPWTPNAAREEALRRSPPARNGPPLDFRDLGFDLIVCARHCHLATAFHNASAFG